MSAEENTRRQYLPLSLRERIKHWICFVACALFATALFFGAKAYLKSFLSGTDVVQTSEVVSIDEVKALPNNDPEETLVAMRSNNRCLEEMLEKNGGAFDFSSCIARHEAPPNEVAKAMDEAKAAENGGSSVVEKVIFVIELFLILGLAVQSYFFIYSLWLSKSSVVDYYIFHASDWAINTPPILGVLVNLLAFGAMLSQGAHKIQSLFTENFYLAIVTTLIGGVFYIINMALKIVIQSRIDVVYRHGS